MKVPTEYEARLKLGLYTREEFKAASSRPSDPWYDKSIPDSMNHDINRAYNEFHGARLVDPKQDLPLVDEEPSFRVFIHKMSNYEQHLYQRLYQPRFEYIDLDHNAEEPSELPISVPKRGLRADPREGWEIFQYIARQSRVLELYEMTTNG